MRTTTSARLVLASASPARRRILQAAGIDAAVEVSGVDEAAVEAYSAGVLAGVLARLKAEAVADRLRAGGRQAGTEPDGRGTGKLLVLGCDSVLEFDGDVLGKPADAAEAAKRWRGMRGRTGVLHTGHCLIDVSGYRSTESVAATTVHFADVTDEEIAAYVASGEPLRVAGAFTIDGLGGPFVERIEGDAGTVIGLSLPLLRALLARLGFQITDLWRPGAP